jgi:ATP-dependent Clp protease ATP-binding subunit ClpC
MFERFSDRARKVLALANQEAQRFNHEYIGTEHILLGLVKEGSGVGANVLKNLGVDFRRVRLEVEKLVTSGPDMVTMGKMPQTPRAKKAIEYAVEESRNLGHNYIGTEHLLLGLLREHDGIAAQVLMGLGIAIEQTRKEVVDLLGAGSGAQAARPATRGPYVAPTPTWHQSPGARRVIAYAAEEARNLNHNQVGTQHLLLGLLREADGVGAQVLIKLGLDLDKVREEVLRFPGTGEITNNPI